MLSLLQALLFAASPATAGGASLATGRAFVLDRENPSITAVDVPSGRSAGRLALTGRPVFALLTADGSRLVVLDKGPGKDKGKNGYQASGRAAATVVDATTLVVIARVELGWGLLGGDDPAVLRTEDG